MENAIKGRLSMTEINDLIICGEANSFRRSHLMKIEVSLRQVSLSLKKYPWEHGLVTYAVS